MRLAGKVFIIKGFFAEKEGTEKPGGGPGFAIYSLF
jgi:hypothetical protein